MNHNQINKINYDECVSKGVCTISPSLAFLQEVIKSYLKELAYYILKLKEFGVSSEKVKEDVIDIISGLIINVHYNEEQFSKTITNIYSDLIETKELYASMCEKNNLEAEFIKSTLKIQKKINILDAIRQGQKIFTSKNKKTTVEQKNLFEIMFSVIKSVCIHLIELRELDVDYEEAYETLLWLFNARNSYASSQELKDTIKKSVQLDYSILQKIQEAREEEYGQLIPAEVSTSIRPNKAILVSGSNIRELELLLKATKNRGIDVYTHGHMIIAHSLPKFKNYPHLVGHFGKGMGAYLLDFSTFPGAVFVTRHSFHRIENYYRGRIFTSDTIAPKGVVTIKNNNFEPLIESALGAKGFMKEKECPIIKIDLDQKKILQKISEVAEKIEKNEIKYFFAIGVSNGTKIQKEYFEKFLNLLGDDCFVLSFTYTNHANNVLCVDSEYGFPILYKALDILTQKIKIYDLNPIMLYTRCEVHTISNVLNMKYMGINKIYFPDCPPNLVNPALIEAMRKMFGLKKYTNPQDDLKAMLKE